MAKYTNIDTDTQDSPVKTRGLHPLEKYSAEFSSLGDDYVFSHINGETPAEGVSLRNPVRAQGITILLCLGGSLRVDVNLTPYTIEPGSLLIIGHDNIFHVNAFDSENIDLYLIATSIDFMKDINLDMGVLQSITLSPIPHPLINLTPEQTRLIRNYMEMIHTNTMVNTSQIIVRSIARCLMAALVCQIIQIIQMGRLRDPEPSGNNSRLTRRNNYVRDFIKLVHEYHSRERSVAFYASRLFISAKYLSSLVREASGRSAAEWIDEFVILEAKNLLRFSGKNIQQVAYELNFSNQSAFGKYFKHLTGMSPTEFQRT